MARYLIDVLIMEANRIAIFGLGNSAAIAMDAQHKFQRAGINEAAYSDNHMQAIVASHLTKDDVAIGISHSGSSIDIVEALKIAQESGATTISITNFGKSPIDQYSDSIVHCIRRNKIHNIRHEFADRTTGYY